MIVECASDQLWGTGIPLGELSCLDHMKWISQGIMGHILECIRSEENQARHFHYQQPPPSFPNTCEQLPQSLIPNVLHKSHVVAEQQIPPSDSIAAPDTSATASTTPASDTTASDTDPGENFLANGTPDKIHMDDNENT